MMTCRVKVPCRCALVPGLLLALALIPAGCEGPASPGRTVSAAPDFEFEPIDGKPRRLSDLRGQPVIVNFFATWCPPCMMELPELDRKIARAFADRGLTVIAIGLDDDPGKVIAFSKAHKYSFVMVADPKSEILSKFTSADGIPQTYLIDPEGMIAMSLMGYNPEELNELKAQVEKLLPASK